MKKLLLLVLLVCSSFFCFSQYIHKIKADSVVIHNDSCNAELILKNSTKNIDGFLYNRGNGRTEFRKALLKVNDSIYLVGGDTLYLGGRPAGDSSFAGKHIFYVAKRYDGIAGAIVTGLKKDSVKSANATYTKQLQNAKPGTPLFPFPDPFSARNAALDALAAGQISSAVIVIMAGNSYTVGSDNPAQNGDLNYNANSNVTADIGFSSVNGTNVASLMQNKINYYFEQDAGLHYINSSYIIWMSYHQDLNDPVWKSGIYGDGLFKQYYGQQQAFQSGLCFIDNANAEVNFKAQYLELQYYKGFFFDEINSFYIDVDRIRAGYMTILRSRYTRNSNKDVHGYFNCNDLVYGQGKTQNQFNDYWPAFHFGLNSGGDTTTKKKDITINIGNANICVGLTEGDGFLQIRDIANTNISFNINNLRQTSATTPVNAFASLISTYFGKFENLALNVNIKNAVTEYPLFGNLKNSYGSASKPCRFNFHCDLHRKLPSSVYTHEWAKRNINIQNDYASATVAAKLTISGTYINESNSEVVAMDYTNISKLTELKGYFKTTAPGKHVMILNGYQNKRFAITDATLINDGVTSCIALKGSHDNYARHGGANLNSSRTVYIKNVHANSAPEANVSTVGDTIKVVSDLAEYY